MYSAMPPLFSIMSFTTVPPADLDVWLNDDAALIVDIRPPAAFSSARVPRAVSLSVPSTLLKRPLFSLERLTAMLSSPSARSRFSSWASASRILVYDADSTAIGDSSNINGLLRKFNAGGFHGELAWLKGGFHAVWRDRRDIIDTLPPTPEVEVEEEEEVHDKAAHPILRPRHLPMAAFSLSSTTHFNASQPNAASFPASKRPSAIARSISSPPNSNTLSHPAFNPFFDTVRQNTELSHGITDRIPLRLPHRVRRRIHELPFRWLQDIARRAANAPPTNKNISDTSSSDSENDSDTANPADIEEGQEALAMQFFKIELSEQRRLMGIMEHHSKESGHATDAAVLGNPSVFPFSITAGVEKGAKNRYRHIWPFEHARVRLHQRRHADDDYINASYIQPLGTERRYIATQGPLPATFTDFWTLCWQQNVQVIVMLTREVEGAMVKCGAYWTDSAFGPLRLRLVSSEGIAVPDDRPVSAGFFGPHNTLSTHSPRPAPPKYPHSAGSQRRYRHHHYHNNRSETVKRTFELTHTAYPDAKPRRIIHFQYLDWPDMNVPDDPRGVLGLIKQVEDAVKETRSVNYSRETPKRDAGEATSVLEMDEKTGIAKHALANSPVLLHCSAGVGRTGGFIAVDAVLDAIRREVRGQHEVSKTFPEPMDVDEQNPSSLMTPPDPMVLSPPSTKNIDIPVHTPTTPSILSNEQPYSSGSDLEAAFTFPSKTSQWAQDVSHETGISGVVPPQTSTSGFNLNSSATPSSTGGSPQTYNSLSSIYHNSSSSPLGTSVSGTSSSSKVNYASSIREITSPLKHLLGSEHASPDQRLRTISAPSGTRHPIVHAAVKNLTLPLRLDFSSMARHNTGKSFSNSPFVPQGTVRQGGISSDGEPPSRSESPSADEASVKAPVSHSVKRPQSSLDPMHSSARLNSQVSPPAEEQQKTSFDYKEPRPLHETFTPPPLSSLEEPIWEVVQDMREQRMSLCQSLRQYVFVHAAIIEGSLMVVDEENEIADGLRPRQHASKPIPSPMSSLASRSRPSSRGPTAHLHLARSESVGGSSSSSYSIGKRPSTPTELLKKDKEGEVMLAKRPSMKRKQTGGDALDHVVENMRYHPIPLRATSSVVLAGGISAPSSKVLPP